MILPINEKLRLSAELVALVGDRIFEDEAPLKTETPYIVWQELSGDALNNLDKPADIDHVSYQVMCYDTQITRAYQLREFARKALENDSWINNSRINFKDPATKLFARGFDGNWFLDR